MTGNQLIVLSQAYVYPTISADTFKVDPDCFPGLVSGRYIEAVEPRTYKATDKGHKVIKKMLSLQDHDSEFQHVGYLIHGHFMCMVCSEKWLRGYPTAVKIFRGNIGIYSQTCFECNALIVDGAKKASSEDPLCIWE